jgi:hypothetical protein
MPVKSLKVLPDFDSNIPTLRFHPGQTFEASVVCISAATY